MQILGLILFMLGSVLVFISALGLVRMKDAYLMLQATGVAATSGITLIFLATGIYFNSREAWLFSGLALLFNFITSPVSTHMLALTVFWNRRQNMEEKVEKEVMEEE